MTTLLAHGHSRDATLTPARAAGSGHVVAITHQADVTTATPVELADRTKCVWTGSVSSFEVSGSAPKYQGSEKTKETKKVARIGARLMA